MALPQRALRGKIARFQAGKRGVPKNNFPGQKARTAGAKLAAQPRSNASRNTFSKPSPTPWIGPASPDRIHKINMLRLQLLDTLRPFSEERSICAGLRVHCRRRCVLPHSDGTSFETRRLRGRDLCFGPAFVGQLADRKCAGLILLDVRIPGLSGPELQSRLSELGSTLPIIFLTGHADIPTTVRTIKAGADDFLTKPVSSDELLRAVERAIARHRVTFGLKSKLDAVRAHIAALTPRERQVFELVIRGNTNSRSPARWAGPNVPLRPIATG